jgi:Zn-dependent protease
MISFNFLGIPVRIAPWFWITMIFIGGGTTMADRQDLINVALFVFAGFISILIHELGHALTVRKYGLPSLISLTAFGGLASFPAGVLDRRQSFLVTAAGPGIQFLLGLLAIVVIRTLPIPETSLLLVLLMDLIWISLVWSIFNCLPIYPLDGGQMLGAVVGDKRTSWVHITSIACATIIGILLFWQLGTWIMPAFMAYFVWINYQGLKPDKI